MPRSREADRYALVVNGSRASLMTSEACGELRSVGAGVQLAMKERMEILRDSCRPAGLLDVVVNEDVPYVHDMPRMIFAPDIVHFRGTALRDGLHVDWTEQFGMEPQQFLPEPDGIPRKADGGLRGPARRRRHVDPKLRWREPFFGTRGFGWSQGSLPARPLVTDRVAPVRRC
jgi:hypothetical protein